MARRARSRASFPSVPFFGLTALRAAEAPALAQCAALDFADVLVESVDDSVVRDLVLRHAFSTRFNAALSEPPPRSVSTRRCNAPRGGASWRGRAVRCARSCSPTRSASRASISAGRSPRSGAPNLKRVIDLVRLIAAAELAKNPGYDVRDVAAVLDFASSSHLSSTAQRVVGMKPASLARLRAVDLIERFTKGHGRSRG